MSSLPLGLTSPCPGCGKILWIEEARCSPTPNDLVLAGLARDRYICGNCREWKLDLKASKSKKGAAE